MNCKSHLGSILRVLLHYEHEVREAAACDTELTLGGVCFDANAGWCDFVCQWMDYHGCDQDTRNAMKSELRFQHEQLFNDFLYPVGFGCSLDRSIAFMGASPMRMWTTGAYAEDRWTKLRELVEALEAD